MQRTPDQQAALGARERELLGPFGRAWGKVITAYTSKITAMPDAELAELAQACAAGRWHHSLEGNDYWCATEVERICRTEINRRGLA